MDDTRSSVKKIYQDMIEERPPEERLRMGCSMFTTAKAMVEASIREDSPALSLLEIRKRIFLRFYGEDFSSVCRDKILKELDK